MVHWGKQKQKRVNLYKAWVGKLWQAVLPWSIYRARCLRRKTGCVVRK